MCKSFKCETCQLLCKNGTQLVSHASMFHGETLTNCDICQGKLSSSDQQMHSHFFQHYKCKKCCIYFKEKAEFENHACKNLHLVENLDGKYHILCVFLAFLVSNVTLF